MNRAEQYSLILLAGGKSSRMGSNKAELLYEGKTFVQNLTEKAEKLGITKIYLSGFEEKECHEINRKIEQQTVWDIYPERGPLGGIHACMKKMTTPYCLILPVDVPQIPVEVLETLLREHETKHETDYVIDHEKNHKTDCEKNSVGNSVENHVENCADHRQLPLLLQHGDRKEHLIAVYSATMVSFIEELIKEHPASVHGMLEQWGFVCCQMDIEEWQAANINTRANYQELLSQTKAGGQKEC